MSRSLAFKLGASALLTALLLLVLARIDSLVAERQALRDAVVRDIARSSTYEQQLTGPILVVPYNKTERVWVTDPETRTQRSENRTTPGELRFLPEALRIDGQLNTQVRHRGIYQARVYRADLRLSAAFSVPAHNGIEADADAYQFGRPFLAVGVGDIRGIGSLSAHGANGGPLEFSPGSGTPLLSAGVRALLPQAAAAEVSARRVEVSIEVSLAGTGQLLVTPVGRQTRVAMSSNWHSPSFIGDYLPQHYDLNGQGFKAVWETSFFATNLEEVLRKCDAESACADFTARPFGVAFADPVDQYLQTDRAIKYALLFILPTFVALFLYEMGRKLAIHPIQYALVGAALAVFYVLLLSLSEHVGFAIAYLVSTCACVALIGFYICNALRNVRHGIGFTAALSALYALLYVILSAEDYALLAGSLLVFGLLAALMITTRHINWFDLEAAARRDPADTGPGR